MNHKAVLSLTLLASLAATTVATSDAHADVVSDRVLLVTGSSYGCSGAIGFRRLVQEPDGGSTLAGSEFQVPDGSYLEITSVEYTTPHFFRWATTYVQSIDLNIRRRSNGVGTNVFSAKYQNAATYVSDGNAFEGIDEYVTPGAQTRVAAFPVGPLMSSAGRLCLSASSNFGLYGGSVRVRGRLIPTGSPIIVAPTTRTF